MEFSIQLVQDDWKKMMRVYATLPTDPPSKETSYFWEYTLIIAATVFAVCYFIKHHQCYDWKIIIPFSAYFSTIYILSKISTYRFRKSTFNRCMPGSKSCFWEVQYFKITKESIHSKNSMQNGSISWAAVYGIEVVDDVIYILTCCGNHIFLPKERLKDPETVLQKLNELHSQYNQDSKN